MKKTNQLLCLTTTVFILGGIVGAPAGVAETQSPPKPALVQDETPGSQAQYRNRYVMPVPDLNKPVALAPLAAAPLPPVASKAEIVQVSGPKLAPVPNLVNAPVKLPPQQSASPILNAAKRLLSLMEVQTMATMAHPALQQAARQAESFKGAWVQAGLKENPMLGYTAEEMTDDSGGKQGIGVNQRIIPKYKLNARQATASREYQAACQQYQIQRQKVLNDALVAAYRVGFSLRKCQILGEMTQIARESQQAGDALAGAKEISRSTFLDIKIQAERTRMALGDTEIAYKTACRELAVLIGQPVGDLIEITDPVEAIPVELDDNTLLAEIRTMSPELKQAYAEIEAARAKLRQECAEAGIDFDASAKIAYDTQMKQTEFSAGVAIPLKIFNRNQGNIQRAQSEVAAACRNADRVELLLASKFEKLLGEYRTARKRVVSYQEGILAESRESFNLAQTAYKRGEYGSLELLDAQRTLSTVQVEYLDNLEKLLESQVLLQGSLLSGGLEKPEMN